MAPHEGRYIQMFSIHGLVRHENMQLGYDADTGGQIKYVVELCKKLSEHPDVRQVDLFTRLIQDKSFSDDYGKELETVNDKCRIVRVQCGGKKYLRKELLWPFLDEFVDKTIKFIRRENAIPDLVHGHYPDAGYVARELARFFDLPFVYTGHSLGRSKKARLLDDGMALEEMNRKLKIDHRIDMEEAILASADLVVTSTRQEIKVQYGQYRNHALPEYRVIPPGIGIHRFYPFYHEIEGDSPEKEQALFTRASLTRELDRFFQHPDKPLILVLCRPDKRKNIQGLIKAFGEDQDLQAMANLAVFAGLRKDISRMPDNERDVLTQMLLLMDKYNLYGKMAIPKTHDFEHEVPELYRIAARKRGVFVNPALTEPFGLTLLESLACGLPVAATNDGGPKDIMDNCQGGILVDPTDAAQIARAVRNIISSPEKWDEFSRNGILNTRKFYTWKSHAGTYIQEIQSLCTGHEKKQAAEKQGQPHIGRRLKNLSYMLITDIDDTLLGGDADALAKLSALLEKYRSVLGFGVATGRRVASAVKILKDNNVPDPDIVISSVGSEISYGTPFSHDKGWQTHISKDWKPDLIKKQLADIDFLTPQETELQGPFKLSYYMAPGKDRLAEIHHVLTSRRFRYSLIYSQDKYLDILPFRASKGKAVRYLSYKWEIPLKHFLVCGDSGNDEEMLKGETLGLVVGNFCRELAHLKTAKNIYFAKQPHAAGMMEGIGHYQLIEKAKKTHDHKK
ncbi:MAG TPA: HAD-IIB family hydrolase [Desulfotignum sp.]|nr:HAD-IIB family hydrolase [Desulfotignum sp.]